MTKKDAVDPDDSVSAEESSELPDRIDSATENDRSASADEEEHVGNSTISKQLRDV